MHNSGLVKSRILFARESIGCWIALPWFFVWRSNLDVIETFLKMFMVVVLTGFLIFMPFIPARAFGIIVCLDPGHGGSDPGAVGNGIKEKDVNLDIALRARKLLTGMGYQVIMTREKDVHVSLEERCRIANSCGAEAFLSIHNNASAYGGEGTETYCYYNSEEGRILAKSVHSQVVSRIGLKNRGVKEAGFYVLANTDMPAALLECAFISNPKEAEFLKKPSFRQKIAEGIAAGMADYLRDPGLFTEYIPLMNPDSSKTARVRVDFLATDGRRRSEIFEILPLERHTLNVDREIRNADVSTVIRSENGVKIVCERTMYFNFSHNNGGHCSKGATSFSRNWYLAEGSTAWGFSTFIVILNPGNKESKTALRLLRADGFSEAFEFFVPPASRLTVNASKLKGFEYADFSTVVTSDEPVVVERAMYFSDFKGISGGHASCAAPRASRRWYFAEGYTGKGFDTFILMANPNTTTAKIHMVNMLPGGRTISNYLFIGPESRKTIHLNLVSGLESTDVSTVIYSNVPVLAERSIYFDYHGIKDGSNSFGTPVPLKGSYLAEGYAGEGFDTFLLLMNPNEQSVAVTARFILSGGKGKDIGLVLPPYSRTTIKTNGVAGLAGKEFGMAVLSKKRVVVERSVYFTKGNISGGHCEAASSPSSVWYFAEGCTR